MLPINRIEIIQADITMLDVDAVVNAANTSLLGGGGVDGAIHRAAGPGLAMECRMLNGCKVGQAKITSGHNLPARWIIHTVGPVWQNGQANEDELLTSCYRSSLALAEKHSIAALAFPAISTGIYRFPVDRATQIALQETLQWLETHSLPEKVIFVCFSEDVHQIYVNRLGEINTGEV